MHKKYYFAATLIIMGILMGILSFVGLNKVGFNNRGVPIVVVISVSGTFIFGGLLFIIFGGSAKK